MCMDVTVLEHIQAYHQTLGSFHCFPTIVTFTNLHVSLSVDFRVSNEMLGELPHGMKMLSTLLSIILFISTSYHSYQFQKYLHINIKMMLFSI